MTSSEADGGAADLDARLRAFTDEARAAAGADARRREASLRHQASEEGTVAGVLLDLAERDQLLSVTTAGGRTLRGVIRTIGADFVGLRAPGGEGAMVPTASITAIRTEPQAAPTVGDRAVHIGSSLRVVLSDLATERPWVSVHTVTDEGVAGTLWSVGQDVLAVRAAAATTTYVPMAMVGDVVLP